MTQPLFMHKNFTGHYIFLLGATAVFSLGVGFLVGFVACQSNSGTATASSKSLRIKGNQFTSPLLLGDVDNENDSPNLSNLSKQVQNIISHAKKDGSLTSASVFYRTLAGHEQINVNGEEKYFPASLTKVPLMMDYLKMDEANPGLLATEAMIQFDQDYNADQEMIPERAPQLGHQYSLNDLLSFMIKFSDNNSFNLLIDRPGAQDGLRKLYTDFQLYYPFDDIISDVMTAHDYSRFLRALYSATYLSVADSEKALGMMSETDFKSGIVAGVPNGVVVAHKFGLNTNKNLTGTVVLLRQLHDCGIVYKPKQPYVLCIMTKSTADLPKIESVIKKISSTVYDATK